MDVNQLVEVTVLLDVAQDATLLVNLAVPVVVMELVLVVVILLVQAIVAQLVLLLVELDVNPIVILLVPILVIQTVVQLAIQLVLDLVRLDAQEAVRLLVVDALVLAEETVVLIVQILVMVHVQPHLTEELNVINRKSRKSFTFFIA